MYDLLNTLGFFSKVLLQQIQSDVSISSAASPSGAMQCKLELEKDLETIVFVKQNLCSAYTEKFIAQ